MSDSCLKRADASPTEIEEDAGDEEQAQTRVRELTFLLQVTDTLLPLELLLVEELLKLLSSLLSSLDLKERTEERAVVVDVDTV